MRYHNITTDDMLNGDGLRTVLWLSGCDHQCKNCQNPITWDHNSGLEFDENAEKELFEKLDKSYISGLTLSGGDPLNIHNIKDVLELLKKFRERYKNTKTVWLYSGYTIEEIMKSNTYNMNIRKEILELIDVFVDGKFVEELKDPNYKWAGSTNQKIIRFRR